MNNLQTPLLGMSTDELRIWLVHTAVELHNTKLAAQEELQKRDHQLNDLQHLLTKALRQIDDAKQKSHRLVFQNLLFLQQKGSSIEDQPIRGIDSGNGFSPSDCVESMVSSPAADPIAGKMEGLVAAKPLPEKGKLLEAVMEAGPLLQNLLLAGPLPQWRHPPPPLESFDIPPVNIPSPPLELLRRQSLILVNRKRVLLSEGSDLSVEETNFKRVLHY